MNTILFVGEHPKTYDVRWHTHEHWELVYCTSGQGSFRFENGTVMTYQAGEVVVIPPREVHANSSSEGFTNIHITMEEPSFPYKTAFRIADDEEGNVKMAFLQAKYFYMGDIKTADLVLAALGDLIASYMIVCRSNAEFSEPVEKIRSSIRRNYSRPDYALDEVIREIQVMYFGSAVFTLKHQGKLLYTSLNNLKAIASPFALLVLGGQFEFSAVKGLMKEIAAGTVWRIVLAPLLGIGGAIVLRRFAGILNCGVNEYPALVAMFGSPVAVSSAVMAGSMGGDEQLAAQLVVWTSLLSILTIFAQVCILMSIGLLTV